MDFMKAFYKVSHSHLIHKLQYYGVHDKLLQWFQDFLHDRSQKVTYNGFISSSNAVDSGVPQG